MPAGFYNGEVMFADNVRFDGGTQPGQVTTNGQLLIGSTVAPNIRVGNLATPNAGSTVTFDYSSPNINLNVTDSNQNTLLGNISGNLTLTGNSNSGFGYNSLHSLTSGVFNTAIGWNALGSAQGASSNVAVGRGALQSNVGSFDNTALGHVSLASCTGGNNVGVGSQALISLANGALNVAVGYASGSSYTGAETGNILLGNQVLGTLGESNVTRIGGGSAGNQTKCFISGIASVSVSNAFNVVIDSTTGQLGTIAGNAIQEATVVLTNSQIKALNATPITVIAAPGAGKAIIVMNAVGKMTYGTNIFVAALGQGVALAYNTTAFNTILTSVDLVSAASVYAYNSSASLSTGVLATTIENIAVKAYNPIGTEITGNAANDTTITLVVKYYVVTI